ncbi:MAG TPA: hypothetical protein VEI97_07045 [bacterium]|nr:hypothetical protein [bacterium]
MAAPTTSAPIQISLYTLAKLLEASPTSWISILQQAQSPDQFWATAYDPLRHAIELDLKGSKDPEAPLRELAKGAEVSESNWDKTIARKSQAAFAVWRQKYRPEFRELLESYYETGGPFRFRVGAVEVTGGPHFKVRTRDGSVVYLYVTAGDYPMEQRITHTDLLAMAIEECRMGERHQVWYLDLSTPQLVKPPEAWKQRRKAIRKCADMLTLLESGRAVPVVKQAAVASTIDGKRPAPVDVATSPAAPAPASPLPQPEPEVPEPPAKRSIWSFAQDHPDAPLVDSPTPPVDPPAIDDLPYVAAEPAPPPVAKPAKPKRVMAPVQGDEPPTVKVPKSAKVIHKPRKPEPVLEEDRAPEEPAELTYEDFDWGA